MKHSYSIIVLYTLCTFCPLVLFSQAPDTLWTKTYGWGSVDQGYSVQQTTDGGYIIAGSTFQTSHDVWLLRTNSLGDTLWTKIFGGVNEDQGISVQQTIEGGYIVAGHTYSFGSGSSDVYLIKFDTLGDTLWTKTYGGLNGDYALSVQQTVDYGYIIAGYTLSFGSDGMDAYFIKTDSLGDTLWTRTYGGFYHDVIWSVAQTSDSGYILAGYTESYAPSIDLYLIRTDNLGNTRWVKTYGGSSPDVGYKIFETIDHGYIIGGTTGSYGAGNRDFWLVKTDSLGDTLWTRTYGGVGSDFCYTANMTSDKGYVLSGRTNSFGAGSFDLYVVRTDSLGNQCWTLTCGGTQDEEACSVQQTSDQGYIVAGHTASFGAGIWDVYLIKIAPDTMGVREYPGSSETVVSNTMDIQISPNPFCDQTLIELTIPEFKAEYALCIYDATGRSVKNMSLHNLPKSVIAVYWDGRDDVGTKLASGVYFVTLRVANHSVTKKILLIR